MYQCCVFATSSFPPLLRCSSSTQQTAAPRKPGSMRHNIYESSMVQISILVLFSSVSIHQSMPSREIPSIVFNFDLQEGVQRPCQIATPGNRDTGETPYVRNSSALFLRDFTQIPLDTLSTGSTPARDPLRDYYHVSEAKNHEWSVRKLSNLT